MKPAAREICALVVAMAAASISHAAEGPLGQPDAAHDAFVGWARARAIPLQPLDSLKGAIDIDALQRVVGTARVVALGEPAHGAHEPLTLRNRLFQSLVEHLGFTAIALESGSSESRRVNDFVTGGPGDAAEIAQAGLTWGFGGYSENVELLRWIREYNAARAHGRKVRFYGIDLSGGGSDGRLAGARIALDDALAYLSRVAPDSSSRARGMADPYLAKFTHEGYLALSQDERVQLHAAIDDMIAIFESERGSLVAASSTEDYEWAYRDAIVARQIVQMFRAWPADTPGDAPTPGLYKAAEARDASMADNVQWVLEREGSAGRVLVFAHNAHVMNARLRGGLWDVYPKPPRTMGQHLRAALGKDVLIIGTSSATNGAGLPVAAAGAGSLDTALARVGVPHFLLDLREARRTPELARWLDQSQSMRANFTTEIALQPRAAFDAVVFIDRLTSTAAARPQH